MKPLLRLAAAAVIVAGASSALNAQSLNITSPNFSSTKLFDSTPGFTITGLGAGNGGEIFYIESDGAFPPAANTRLYKRLPGDGYATPTLVFDFNAPLFGSFVVLNGGKVYFGESSTGAIRSVNPDGTGLDQSP